MEIPCRLIVKLIKVSFPDRLNRRPTNVAQRGLPDPVRDTLPDDIGRSANGKEKERREDHGEELMNLGQGLSCLESPQPDEREKWCNSGVQGRLRRVLRYRLDLHLRSLYESISAKTHPHTYV